MLTVFIGISKQFACIEGMTMQSIFEHATVPVHVVHLYPKVEEGCTGFSNVRYAIRRGIYLDCDMIVLGDIAELMQYHRPGWYSCMQDGSTEVGVIDCEHNVQNKRQESMLPKNCVIPPEWNSEDRVMPGAKLVHYTDLSTQPWFYEHPNPEAVELYERYSPRH